MPNAAMRGSSPTRTSFPGWFRTICRAAAVRTCSTDAPTIKQQAFYVQDDVKAGPATIKLGLRGDHYDGLASKFLLQPRLGVAYAIPGSGTVLRASYGRTLETPYNENLILSSTADPAIFGTSGEVLRPGVRDQFEGGVQQAFGQWVVVDAGYFYKKTTNAYDFGVLFDTPIFFPVSWDHSKLDGFTARVNLVEHHGLSAFTVMGHTNAIFTPPGTGGLLLEAPEGTFRIDHDQKFQQTTHVQYTLNKTRGVWGALSWRYDSGLVAGSVPDYATALTLTADQQAAIGLYLRKRDCHTHVSHHQLCINKPGCDASAHPRRRHRGRSR